MHIILAYIKVNEGMTGLIRVFKDVRMHLDIQDELHKYKVKMTQIKCDQRMDSPGKLNTKLFSNHNNRSSLKFVNLLRYPIEKHNGEFLRQNSHKIGNYGDK